MLKLVKYEFRKNLYSMLVMGGMLIAAQVYFLYACFIADDRNKALAGAWLLFMVAAICFFMVFITGVITYSRELSNKTSYLVFMTPNSAIKIIGSKLLYTFLNGALVLAILAILGIFDWKLLMKMWEQEVSMLETIADMLGSLGVDTLNIMYSLLALTFRFLVSFFMAITLAYMSVTATATILQNKKIKGLISVVLYILVFVVVNKVGGLFPRLYENPESFTQVVMADFPCMIFFLIIVIGSVMATSQLLEKHVSL